VPRFQHGHAPTPSRPVARILGPSRPGRSTFYTHFRDREALLVACFDNLRDELRREIDTMTPGASRPDPACPAAAIFAHAQRRRPVYRALCGKQGGNIVIGHLHELVRGLLQEHLQPHLDAAGSDMPVEVAAEFYATATVGLLSWWVERDFPYEPSHLTQMYRRLATPGVHAILGQPALSSGRLNGTERGRRAQAWLGPGDHPPM
jgi:AcrR family transcriptional regulator